MISYFIFLSKEKNIIKKFRLKKIEYQREVLHVSKQPVLDFDRYQFGRKFILFTLKQTRTLQSTLTRPHFFFPAYSLSSSPADSGDSVACWLDTCQRIIISHIRLYCQPSQKRKEADVCRKERSWPKAFFWSTSHKDVKRNELISFNAKFSSIEQQWTARSSLSMKTNNISWSQLLFLKHI